MQVVDNTIRQRTLARISQIGWILNIVSMAKPFNPLTEIAENLSPLCDFHHL